jgi:hypothetical protein
MSEVNVWKILNVQARVSYAQKKAKELRYFKIQALDTTWMISSSANLMDVIKKDLTEAEADAYLKLLKEQ